VHAHQDAKQPIAIIYPHEANLRHALTESKNGYSGNAEHDELSTLCHDEGVRKLVLSQCNDVGKKSGFKPLEMLEAIVLVSDEWTPESGLVTAAQKIQRKKIAETYKDEIKVSVTLVHVTEADTSEYLGCLSLLMGRKDVVLIEETFWMIRSMRCMK